MPNRFPAPPLGKLRRPFFIQQKQTTPDGQGGAALTWVNVTRIWLGLSAWKGQELMQADQVSTIQYWEADGLKPPNVTITTAMRVLDANSGKVYNIRFVADPDQGEMYLHMTLEAIRQDQAE